MTIAVHILPRVPLYLHYIRFVLFFNNIIYCVIIIVVVCHVSDRGGKKTITGKNFPKRRVCVYVCVCTLYRDLYIGNKHI